MHYADMTQISEIFPADPLVADGADDDSRWAAVLRRDRACDGLFVMGVGSTHIYCRPSCPARRPKRTHVRFFASSAEARGEGFRACLRCLPDEVSREEAAVARALAVIQASDQPPALGVLAAITGYSAAHFQRLFTRATGLSPSAYGRALRMERARQSLSDGNRVTDALYNAGFAASSRFYEASRSRLGMAPSAWAGGGRGVVIHWGLAACRYGPLLIAATDKGVCRVAFGEGAEELARRFPLAELVQGGAEFAALLAQVVAQIESPGTGPSIPLDVRGTAFQEAVWQQLQRIPPGETRSYGEIAAAMGKPGAMRAVGSANGANPVAVLVPCHRVIRSDGAPGGYAWGLEIKEQLLAAEAGQTKE